MLAASVAAGIIAQVKVDAGIIQLLKIVHGQAVPLLLILQVAGGYLHMHEWGPRMARKCCNTFVPN